MLKRIVTLFPLLVTVILLLFSSCTYSESVYVSNDEYKDYSVSKDIILKTTCPFGGKDPAKLVYESVIREFERKNTGVYILNESSNAYEERKSKINSDFACGSGPDIMFYDIGVDATSLIENNFVVSIEEIQSVYPDYAANISEDLLSTIKHTDGKNYAVPINGVWQGLFINKDLFYKYNVPIPTDFDSFLNAVEIFSKTDIIPISASFSDYPHRWIESLILSAGTPEEFMTVPTNPEEIPQSWIDGINMLKMLYNMGAFSENVFIQKNSVSEDNFFNKRAAMRLDGSWLIGTVTDTEETDIVPIYKMDGSSNIEAVGGFYTGFYISRAAWENNEKQKLAYDFIQDMISDKVISDFSKCLEIPISDSADVSLADKIVFPPQVMHQPSVNTYPPMTSRINREAWIYLVNNLEGILNGTMETEEVLAKVIELNNYY